MGSSCNVDELLMMKRLLIAVSLALTGVGAVAFYYWQQATQLPAWYTSSQIEPTGQPSQPAATDPTIAAAPKPPSDRAAMGKPASAQTNPAASKLNSATTATPSIAPHQPTKSHLHQNELAQLFTTEITRKAESKKLGSALKGAKTTMQNGTVESGAVVNFGDIGA